MLPVINVMVAKASDGIVAQIFAHQVDDATEHGGKETGKRSNGGGHMEIDYAEDRPLIQLVRNTQKHCVQVPHQQRPGERQQQ
jgi:hypothetical protein